MNTRITKMEMQGFKSFAKKTTILFPSNFSVICGPNGSGKSNVLDALCFVLGRTSAKSLRAKKMLGMIFNGGEGKKPADFAAVRITFDNAGRVFPLEEDQVAISRKVNRNGVSIYKLNGKTVTREKVLEVLRAANIHPDGHNIILQGDVTEVIEMNPVERRGVIDEISGISEFEEKRAKALSELGTVEERLKESLIILNEKESQMGKLKAEKAAAEEYEKYAKELDRLRASVGVKRLADAEEAMKKLDKGIIEREKDFEKFSKEAEKIEAQLDRDEVEIRNISQRLFDRTKDMEIIKSMEQLRAQISNREAKIESNRLAADRYREMVQKLIAIEEKQRQQSMSRAVQEVLRLNKPAVYGTISSLCKVPPKYDVAIEVAAGPHMQDIVVADSDTVVECVKHLKDNKIGRATFLPLDKVSERDNAHLKKLLKEKGAIDFAINLIQFDKKYWHAFSHVFGDTLIVDSIETARRIGFGAARMVTLDGDLVERGGAVVGGFYRKDSPAFTQSGEIKRYEQQIKGIEEESRLIFVEVEKLKAELEKLLSKEKEGSEELRDAYEKRQKTERQLAELREKRKEINEKKLSSQEELNRLKINRARLEAELENIRQEFAETKKVPEGELYDLAVSTMQAKIRDMLTKISALGPINQKAVEEFKQVKEVYDDLKAKVDMLSSERLKVLEIIAEVEKRRRDTFMKTLNAVAGQFKVIFNDLVGGEGSLRLEGEVLEEAGLMIEASPPGRKVLNIDSMSGGEKTLTALAFIFAIQNIRPAPFYVLDEIDAALDKLNTYKISGFLKKNSELAQFIVISHNDATISAADSVYGVSIEEGESKLVGIRMP
ncbi:MAG: chromosome segregation SMC family protein [Candidatus Aenigmatarchaeota archaeon]